MIAFVAVSLCKHLIMGILAIVSAIGRTKDKYLPYFFTVGCPTFVELHILGRSADN